MTSKRKALIASGLIVAALASVGYIYLLPHHRLATRAEMEKVVDPRLLIPLRSDAEQEQRFEKVVEFAKRFPEEVGFYRTPFTDEERQELSAILEEGPILEPLQAAPTSNGYMGVLSAMFIKMTTSATDGSDAEPGIRLGLLALAKFREGARTTHAIETATWLERNLVEYINASLIHQQLSPKAIERLLPLIPESDCGDHNMQKRLAADMQAALSWMDNPFRFREVPPVESSPGGAYVPSTSHQNFEDAKYSGQYDSLKTARLFSDCLIARLTKQPLPKEIVQAQDSMSPAAWAAASLPFELYPRYPDEKGFSRLKERLKFIWKRNQYPNSAGVALVAFNSFEQRARPGLLELARASLALHLYRARFQSFPKDIRQVVDVGILERVPSDCVTGKKLRFDYRRKLLWSPGSSSAVPATIYLHSAQPGIVIWQ